MADDELIIPIEKAFWPKGVMRALPPLLRELGDKHGNMVIAAVPNKHIMVKGPADKIEEVKPGILEIFEQQFPDAPIPPELGGGGEGDYQEEEWQEEQAPEPEPPKPAEPPKPPEPAKPAASTGIVGKLFGSRAAPAPAATSAASSGPPPKPVTSRKRPRPMAIAPQALLWECTRKNSSFIRNPYGQFKRPFSAESVNLLGLHSSRFSGLAATEALDVRPKKDGVKETIELVQSHAQASRQQRPDSAVVTTGLSKCPKKGLQQIGTELGAKFYRKDLQGLAEAKYVKVQQSFKKKTAPQKSRRMKS